MAKSRGNTSKGFDTAYEEASRATSIDLLNRGRAMMVLEGTDTLVFLESIAGSMKTRDAALTQALSDIHTDLEDIKNLLQVLSE